MNGGSSQFNCILVDSSELRVTLTAGEVGISSSVLTLLSIPVGLEPLLLDEAIDTKYWEYGNSPAISAVL